VSAPLPDICAWGDLLSVDGTDIECARSRATTCSLARRSGRWWLILLLRELLLDLLVDVVLAPLLSAPEM